MATVQQKSDFGTRLRHLREARGLTQAQLAELVTDAGMAVTYQAIQNWELGRTGTTRANALAVEQALGVDPGTLAGILGYTADQQVQLSASGGALEEIRQVDPEYYAQLEEMARLALDRVKKRRRP